MVVSAKQAVLSNSETAEIPGFSRSSISWSETEKTSSERPLCEHKCLVDVRGLRAGRFDMIER